MSIKGTSRTAVERLIARFGYELKIVGFPIWILRISQSHRGVRSTASNCIDMEVENDTHWLYEAFSEAYFVLIEPKKEFEPAL